MSEFAINRRRNVVRKVQVTSARTQVIRYTYDLADRLASLTHPNGGVATYVRDAAGRITSITYRHTPTSPVQTIVSNASYLPFGPLTQLTQLTFGNGRTLTKTYDQDYAIDAISSAPGDGLNLDYTVDAVGNIVSITGEATRTYAYDGLYRLTDVRDQNNALIESFRYDATGNRISKAENGGAPVAYSYPATSHRLAAVGSEARSYDANGNTTAIGATTLAYNDRNRLATVTEGSASIRKYNAKGERTLRDGLPFVYDEGGQLLNDYESVQTGWQCVETQPVCPPNCGTDFNADLGSNAGVGSDLPDCGPTGTAVPMYEARASNLIWLDTVPVASVKVDGEVRFVETDHLATPRLVASHAGVTKWKWPLTGSTFGQHAPNEDVDADGEATQFGLRYPGQIDDLRGGLYYNLYRDYEAATGRYGEVDPIGVFGGVATYSYALSSPVNYVDPTGEQASAGGICLALVVADGPAPIGDAACACLLIGGAVAAAFAAEAFDTYNDCRKNTAECTADPMYSKGGRQRKRNTDLQDWTDEEVSKKVKDKSLSGEERKRFVTEEKARKIRNKNKRKNR